MGREHKPLVMASEDDLKEWWETAERAFALRRAGKKVPVTDFMSVEYEPLECLCGTPYYSQGDDYMCPKCREALDA